MKRIYKQPHISLDCGGQMTSMSVPRCGLALWQLLSWAPFAFFSTPSSAFSISSIQQSSLVNTLLGFFASITAGLLLACYLRYRSRRKELQSRAERISSIHRAQLAMQHAGAEAESRVAEEILSIAQQLDPGAMIQTALVMHYSQSGPGQMPRFEVDCLLITTFSVVVIEVKNWRGDIQIQPDGWTVHKGNSRTHHRSPLAQNAPKVRAIEEIVRRASEQCQVEGIVVMSHDKSNLPPDAPLPVLTPPQLLFYLRSLYHASRSRGHLTPAAITAVRQAIAAVTDSAKDAKHKFLMELSRRNIGAHDYASLQTEREQLERSPLPPPRSLWRYPTMYLPLLAFTLYSYMHSTREPAPPQPAKVTHVAEVKGAAERKSLENSKATSKSSRRSRAQVVK